MLKKLTSLVVMFAIMFIMFEGCSKPPPPPPVSVDEVDGAYNKAMEAKQKFESLEKERDMLKAELKEKQDKLAKAKNCAEGK